MSSELSNAEQRVAIKRDIKEAERHGDLMEIAKGMDKLALIPVGAPPPRFPRVQASSVDDLPVCDVRWALELAAKGGYGVSYTDHAVQDQVQKAYVLVTELIQADLDYNRAVSGYREAQDMLDLSDHEELASTHPASVRLQAARYRRSHVLMRATGRLS